MTRCTAKLKFLSANKADFVLVNCLKTTLEIYTILSQLREVINYCFNVLRDKKI